MFFLYHLSYELIFLLLPFIDHNTTTKTTKNPLLSLPPLIINCFLCISYSFSTTVFIPVVFGKFVSFQSVSSPEFCCCLVNTKASSNSLPCQCRYITLILSSLSFPFSLSTLSIYQSNSIHCEACGAGSMAVEISKGKSWQNVISNVMSYILSTVKNVSILFSSFSSYSFSYGLWITSVF